MPDQVVLISEYTGGGFGSKITGCHFGDHSGAAVEEGNAPVMMRISREEEHYIGRARPALLGRMKVGFTKEGRITRARHVRDLRQRPVRCGRAMPEQRARIVSLLYQPQAMRWRGLTVLTNTPPRGAQSAPGGMQGIAIMEPVAGQGRAQTGYRSGGDPHGLTLPKARRRLGRP